MRAGERTNFGQPAVCRVNRERLERSVPEKIDMIRYSAFEQFMKLPLNTIILEAIPPFCRVAQRIVCLVVKDADLVKVGNDAPIRNIRIFLARNSRWATLLTDWRLAAVGICELRTPGDSRRSFTLCVSPSVLI